MERPLALRNHSQIKPQKRQTKAQHYLLVIHSLNSGEIKPASMKDSMMRLQDLMSLTLVSMVLKLENGEV